MTAPGEKEVAVALRARFLREVASARLPAGPGPEGPVAEADLARLPEPARRYLQFMGVVGRIRDWSFRLGFTGKFRLKPDERDAAVFLQGGTITLERLHEIAERDDLFAVLPLVRQAMGITVTEPDPTRLETALYRGVTNDLRKEGRDPLGTGLILEYLWRCSLEVPNLSLLFAGKDLARDEIGAELVY